MRSLVCYIVLTALIIGNSYAQELDSSVSYSCVVSASKMNAVYLGLDNTLSVSVPGYSNDQIKVKTNQGTLTGENGQYILKVKDTRGKVREAVLSVYVNINDSFYFAGNSYFKIKKVLHPYPCFGSKSGGTISPEEVKTVKEITIKPDYVLDGITYTVDKFKFVIQPVEGLAQFIPCDSAAISEEIIAVLSNVKKGDILIFSNIYAHYNNNSTKQLPGAIVLTVE
ncbi:MAG: hypothetical protein HN600_06160 [Bacteroidetes bacterium]|nr:hypothetical protein [Bacteroidota bacterium]